MFVFTLIFFFKKIFTNIMRLASLFIVHVNGETSLPLDHQKLISDGRYHDQMQKMQAFKHSLLNRHSPNLFLSGSGTTGKTK